MAITLGAEVALAIHMDQAMTYGDIESALVDAGFTSYTIMRNVNYDGSSDAQLFVRSPQSSDGSVPALPAADTLTKLSAALSTMQDASGGDVTPADNSGGDTPAPDQPQPDQPTPDQPPADGGGTDATS